MLKVYCYSRCTTCKKALKWLEENQIEHEVIDIKTNHPDEETLRQFYTMSEAGGASEFVREHTLASGGPYCDCGYKKKGLYGRKI